MLWLEVVLAVALMAASQAVQIDVTKKVIFPGNISSTTSTTTAAPSNANVTTLAATTVAPMTTTTEKPKTNATANATETGVEVWQHRLDSQERRLDEGYYCACDLTINLCDINCCCDVDCDSRALASFVCTASTDGWKAVHELGSLHSCEVHNDLFCVVSKPHRTSTHADSVENVYDAGQRDRVHNHWPVTFADPSAGDDDPENNIDAYRFGDQLHVFHETRDSLLALRISAPLIPGTGQLCAIHLAVRFMADAQSRCIRPAEAHAQLVAELRDQLSVTQLLANHRGRRGGKMLAEFCSGNAIVDDVTNATAPNCVSIAIMECLQRIGAASCRQWRNETAEVEVDEMDVGDLQNHLIRYEIVHDFERIHNCSVFIVYTIDESEIRESEVRFVQLNATHQPHHEVSGPVGYTPGLPIIVSHYRHVVGNVSSAETTADSQLLLDYFNTSSREDGAHHLRVPAIDAQGQCLLSSGKAIAFGRDFRIRCDLPLRDAIKRWEETEKLTSDTTNFTQLCTRMQERVFSVLLANIRHSYAPFVVNQTAGARKPRTIVSVLGNPLNRTDRWTELQLELDNLAEMPAIQGAAVVDEQPEEAAPLTAFRCLQMVLSVRFEFEVVRGRVGNYATDQWTLRAARAQLGPRVNARFELVAEGEGDDGRPDEWQVPLFADGQFLDMTSGCAGGLRWPSPMASWLLAIIVVFNWW